VLIYSCRHRLDEFLSPHRVPSLSLSAAAIATTFGLEDACFPHCSLQFVGDFDGSSGSLTERSPSLPAPPFSFG